MMKFVLVASFLVLAVSAKPAEKAGKYTTKYDNIDIEEILHNDRLFNNYYSCLLGTGKCTPDGAELKGKLQYHLIIFFFLNT